MVGILYTVHLPRMLPLLHIYSIPVVVRSGSKLYSATRATRLESRSERNHGARAHSEAK
jgi:hypothetical protein